MSEQLIAVLITLLVGVLLGAATEAAARRRAARIAASPEEAWDNGFTHGVRTALRVVEGYRKPFITLGQEQGWDLAHKQFGVAVAALLPDEEHAA